MDEHFYIEVNGRRTYQDGEGKPPIFVQAIIDDECMSDIDFFHIVDGYLDWENQGNDDLVIKPLIEFLKTWGDKLIFAFDDRMSKLLYDLDTKAIVDKAYKSKDYFSEDDFLYTRCVALVNGKPFYNGVRNGKRKLNIDLEFEAILYVPAKAWALLHDKTEDEYYDVHSTPVSYETYSNIEGWNK